MPDSRDSGPVHPPPAAGSNAPSVATPKKSAEAVQTPPPTSAPFDSEAATLIEVPGILDAATVVELPHPSEAQTIADVTRSPSRPMSSSRATAGWGGSVLLPTGTVLANRYEILDLLGEGGMGAVYKARDNELDRVIALKVIRPELASHPEILQRFKQELVLARQVTDRNIIRIFDLGEADGIRFITMEYVEGTSLHQMLRERGKLPANEAAEIITQVLSGLRAAHREGVIHRDLKPGNIMQDKQGRILVMDFGLARSLESDGMTKTGAVLGTMEYMSPEQAMGTELDTRSDLFTVGLILFELLTGKMPFKADTALASLLKRMQERAVLVSDLDKTIPQPVVNIVSKCLEKDPKLRYQSAQEIIDDIERWHGGAAATLRFPPVRTWGRDIPWHWVGSIAAIVMLAMVGFFLRGKLTGSSSSPRTSGPVVSLAIVPFRNASGDPSLDWLGASIAEMLTTDVGQSAQLHIVSSDHMHQLLRDLKISAETTLDDSTVRRLADFSNADQLVWGQYAKFGDQIRVDATLQDLKQQRTIPLKESAEQKELLAAVDRLAQNIRNNLAVSNSLIKELKAQAFKPSTNNLDAIRDYEAGLNLARDGNNLDAIKKFEAATKEDSDFALGFAKLGETYAKLGYGDQADDATRKAVDLSQQLPAQERYRILAAQAMVGNDNKKAIEYYENLAKAAPGDSSIQLALAQLEKNTGAYDTAHDYLTKILQREPNHAQALVAIAEVEGERGNPQGALEYLNRGLALSVQLDNDELRSQVMYETGRIYRLLNKPAEALRNYQDALTIRRRLGQKAGVAETLAELAEFQYSQGKPDEAIGSYKEAVQLQRAIGDKPHLSHTLMNLGGLYSDRRKYDDALGFLRESLQMQRDLHDQNYEAMCLSNIGNVYFFTGRYDDALTYYQQSLQLLEKLKLNGEIPAVLYNLGDTSSRMGQDDEAVAFYLRGLEMARSAGNKQLTAFGSYSMGNVFKDQGRYGAAAGAQEDALKIYRELQDRSSAMADVLNGYGQTLALLGRDEDAKKTLDEGTSLAREIKDNGNLSHSLNFQGERLFYSGDTKSAKSLFDQALQVAAQSKDQERMLRAKINLAQIAIRDGQGRKASADLGQLSQDADKLGLKYLAAHCSVLRAEALTSVKDYRAAQAEVDRSLKLSEKSGFKFLLAKAHAVQGAIYRGSGKASEAGSQFKQMHSILQEMSQESHADSFLKRSDIMAMLALN